MKTLVKQFAGDEAGATAIEYGLIAAGIAVLIIGAVYSVGGELTGTFEGIADRLGGEEPDDS